VASRTTKVRNSRLAGDKITHPADSQFKCREWVFAMLIFPQNLTVEGRGQALVSNAIIRSYGELRYVLQHRSRGQKNSPLQDREHRRWRTWKMDNSQL